MKADILKEIINKIQLNKSYTVSIGGVDKEMKGVDFRGHIVSVYKRMKDEDLKSLLDSLSAKTETETSKEIKDTKQVVKQDKSAQNGELKNSESSKTIE